MIDTEEPKEQAYSGWAIVELFGHRRYAGRISEVTQYGVTQARLDVPDDEDLAKFSTHFYGGASLYGVHPTTEETARALARRTKPEPVQRWELPQLGAGAKAVVEDAEIDAAYPDPDPNF